MIDKKTAIEIIETSLEDIKNKKIVEREEMGDLIKYLGYKHAIAVSGIRRSGKTYLLFQLIKKLLNEGKDVAYINFEDPRFDENVEQLNTIYASFLEHKRTKGKIYFFFDEIQNIKKWEKWISSMYEKDIKFIVSGSNASLLASEFSKSLSGRHKLIEIYPIDFKQCLYFKNKSLLDKSKWNITEKMAGIKKLLNEYLHYGGFPEVLFENKKDVLKDYFEDIIARDIMARHNIKFKQSLKELAFILLTNISSLHSLYSLNKTIKARSINTIKDYLMFLEDTYLIIKIPFFSFSLKKQISNSFKVYSVDPGLRNAVSFRFSQDMGKLYENAVAVKLVKDFNKENIYYWKNYLHEEVDFVVKEGNKIKELIQVSYEINDKTRKREINSLLKAGKELKCNNLLVINEDYEAEEKIDNKKIKFIPLWKWLL